VRARLEYLMKLLPAAAAHVIAIVTSDPLLIHDHLERY